MGDAASRFVVHLDKLEYGSEDVAGEPWTGTLAAAGIDVRTFHGKLAEECQAPVRVYAAELLGIVPDAVGTTAADAKLTGANRAQYESAERLLAQLETHPGATVRVGIIIPWSDIYREPFSPPTSAGFLQIVNADGTHAVECKCPQCGTNVTFGESVPAPSGRGES